MSLEDIHNFPLLSPTGGLCNDVRRRMHTFRHRDFNVWGLTAEVLLRLCLLAHPSHSYSYEVQCVFEGGKVGRRKKVMVHEAGR